MTPAERQHHPRIHQEQAQAIQRRGKWNRLQNAIAVFKAVGEDPGHGAYATALDDLDALEVEMQRAGQL